MEIYRQSVIAKIIKVDGEAQVSSLTSPEILGLSIHDSFKSNYSFGRVPLEPVPLNHYEYRNPVSGAIYGCYGRKGKDGDFFYVTDEYGYRTVSKGKAEENTKKGLYQFPSNCISSSHIEVIEEKNETKPKEESIVFNSAGENGRRQYSSIYSNPLPQPRASTVRPSYSLPHSGYLYFVPFCPDEFDIKAGMYKISDILSLSDSITLKELPDILNKEFY